MGAILGRESAAVGKPCEPTAPLNGFEAADRRRSVMAESPHITPQSSAGALAVQRVRPREPGGLAVTFTDIPPDGRIPPENSAYADNISPGLAWTNVPGAATYAVVMQDPDAPQAEPFLHWMMWNIPGEAEGLTPGAGGKLPPDLLSGVQGLNSAGEAGYMGPRPQEGHGPHRYHFQVFALDDALPEDPALPFEDLVELLKAHTLRHGELVGTYERRERAGARNQDRAAPSWL
jgi:Raf kinase inhibitor-like YbhB/YbcL family protein